MQSSAFSRIQMLTTIPFVNSVKLLRESAQKTCPCLSNNRVKRKFSTSQYHLIRRIRKDNQNEDAQSIYGSNINASQTKSSPKELLDEALTFEGDERKYRGDDWLSDPYKAVRKIQKRRFQGNHFQTPPGVTAEETSVILFPGQGTQFVGMGGKMLEYPNVKELYEAASEILQYDLLNLSLKGPASELSQTKYQQPAILLASLAAVEKLRHDNPIVLESCIATAGFSIGEITALTFAGALTFEDAVNVVKVRGEAMQIASEMARSGMMTVFYGHDSKLKFACSVAKEYCQKMGLEDYDCRIASFLYPSCKVVAGNQEALEFIEKNKDDFNIRKLKKLNVSGAFHTDLMKPAAYVFKEVLENTHISDPLIPVYSNIDGRKYKNADHVKKQLPKQIYYPVRWEQTLHTLYEKGSRGGYPTTYECGPGSSLKTILKMVNRKAFDSCSCVEV